MNCTHFHILCYWDVDVSLSYSFKWCKFVQSYFLPGRPSYLHIFFYELLVKRFVWVVTGIMEDKSRLLLAKMCLYFTIFGEPKIVRLRCVREGQRERDCVCVRVWSWDNMLWAITETLFLFWGHLTGIYDHLSHSH